MTRWMTIPLPEHASQHDLFAMVRTGDKVTLRWRHKRIRFTVLFFPLGSQDMLGASDGRIYLIADALYHIVKIKRSTTATPTPEPGMPDAPGLWKDREGRTWIIDKHMQAYTTVVATQGFTTHALPDLAPYTRIRVD